MDFIVGGMPRGGTTFFGQLFNVHEDVYCYFMETNIVRHMFMFGRDRPFPAENIGLLEGWLRAELRPTLVEGTEDARVRRFRRLVRFRELLAEHGLGESTGPGIRVWDEARFEHFIAGLVDLYRSGRHGGDLFREGLRLLRAQIAQVTDRRVFGEKTPDNLFHMERLLREEPELAGFCIVREPYSTLESMKRRALRSETFFDSAFSTDVLRGIADYYRHIDAAHSCAVNSVPGRFHACRFEDLVRDPVAVMERAYRALGLSMTAAAEDILPELSIPTEEKHLLELDLSADECGLIHALMGPMLEHFGYPSTVRARSNAAERMQGSAMLVLSGIHGVDAACTAIENAWMSRSADLFLLSGDVPGRLVVEVHAMFLDRLGVDGICFRVMSSGVELGRCDLTDASPSASLEIPFEAIPAFSNDAAQRGALVRLESSLSFVPITVPGLGPDVRDVSVLIRRCALV